MYKTFIVAVLICLLSSCKAQKSYQDLVRQIDSQIPAEYVRQRSELLKIGVELSSFLPESHSKKGDIDYTEALQKGIDKAGVLLMPDYPLLVNEKGLVLKSNTKLVFRDKSKLVMKENSETHYGVINIREVENIDIYFANIEGDRETHLINKGEWGMGIRIQGARHVNLHAPTITNCWGDGIYLAPSGNVENEKITVDYFKIYRARRNGISLVSGKSILIDNGLISETHGTAPQSAIDIEPNSPSNVLQDIFVRNLTTHNSAGDGVMMSLSNLTLERKDIVGKPQDNNVTIRIENHKDIGSLYAARINGRLADSSKYRQGKLGGEIVFVNPTWTGYSDQMPIRFTPRKDRVLDYGFNPTVSFRNVTLLENSGREVKSASSVVDVILKESKKL